MIRIGRKYINPAAVDAIEPDREYPDERSTLLVGGEWIHIAGTPEMVAERIREALRE